MQDNPHQIVPLANTAGEILQPVRLRCKIVDRTALFGKMKTIKCLGFEGSKALCSWFFSDEVLKTKHGMKMPKEDLMKIMRSKSTPAYENLPLNFYEDGIVSIEHTLNLRQELAFRHLQGETSLTIFQMMSEGLAKFGLNS